MQIEAVPLGVEVFHHFFHKVYRRERIKVDQFLAFFSGAAGECFIAFIDVIPDEFLLLPHGRMVCGKIVVDHVGASCGIDDFAGGVVGQFEKITGIDFVDVPVVHIDAVCGDLDFFREKVYPNVLPVQVHFNGRRIRLPVNGIEIPRIFKRNMVPLQRLVALVGEKHPDLFFSVCEIEEISLLGELEFIGLFRIAPRVVPASADLGHCLVNAVFFVAAEEGNLCVFVFCLGSDRISVVGIDHDDGHIENVVVKNRGIYPFRSIAGTGCLSHAVAPFHKLIAKFGNRLNRRGCAARILNRRSFHSARRCIVDGIHDLSVLRRIDRIPGKITGITVHHGTLCSGKRRTRDKRHLFFPGSIRMNFRLRFHFRFRSSDLRDRDRLFRSFGYGTRFSGLTCGQKTCRQHGND